MNTPCTRSLPHAWFRAVGDGAGNFVTRLLLAFGALFLGEIMGLPICSLCWYQRIAMFPLALLLPFALFPFNRALLRPPLVLALIGLGLAVFHQLLVAGLIPADLQPCRQGVPCSETVIRWFGFVTIPLLSILAFSILAALLAVALRRSRP